MKEQNKTVMVFGVFDKLHPGHRSFLRQARRYGKKLIVVVARDSTAWKLKKKKPKQSERARLRTLQKTREVSRAVLGDRVQSSYAVIRKYKPDLICFGYDQKWLEKDLRRSMRLGKIPRVRFVGLKSYRPNEFHTSLLK